MKGKMVIQIFIILVISLTLPLSAGEENEVLTLERFVTLSCRNDTRFPVILADRLSLAYKEKLALSAPDLVISAAAKYQVNLSDPDRSGPDASLSLSKLFPATGTDLKGTFSVTPSFSYDGYVSSYGASIGQDIARNAFGRSDRLLAKIAGLETRIARYQITEAYEDYLSAVLTVYFQWYANTRSLETARKLYNDYGQLLTNMRNRRVRHVAEDVDVNRVYVEYLDRREDAENAKRARAALLREVQTLTGYTGPLSPQDTLQLPWNDEVPLERRLAAFFHDSRTVRVLDLLERQADLEVKKRADDLIPSARLVLGYSHEESSMNRRKNDILYGGIEVSYNAPGVHERARRSLARAERKKEILSASDRRNRLHLELTNLYEKIESEARLLELSIRRERVALSVVQGQRRRFYQARIPLSDLVLSMNTWHGKRNAVTEHQLKLALLQTEWFRLTDTLLEKSPGQLPEKDPGRGSR